MPLFQKSVVNKYLANLDSVVVAKAYLQFQQFYGDAERIENIRLLKEENYQEGFLREIFVDVLGYTINPNKNYNLTTEFKNLTDSKKADGAILLDEKAIGVIELKSTTTSNLESIREQAFNYRNNQTNCRFVITSNFEKLRFYIDNATDWEEFNLFNLDFENFRKFYLFLSKDSIFNGITAKLKDESKLHEEDITSKLYNDYSVFKHQLFNDLIKLNPAQDKLLLFHKSQKLLDRILFVLFAEDRGLLPPNAITRIIDQWKTLKDLDEEKSLYSRFVKLFNHLDEGHKHKEYELPAYNGGLFKKDSVLDSLIISDNILNTNTIKLSTYDYNTEVDVNILGHIFENSITEIEQVKAEIEGEQTDKNRSRRKKEGIFYTPKYITKYIVDNTVGALCNEKKKELGIDEIENEIIENSRTSKGKLSKKAEALLKKLDDYRAYLLTLKILDPACGSGAFLNQALEFLINEHELIDSYRRELEKDSLGLYDITKSILENNLYGVDINEEAVEIAKLSLWIRTAERGRKLSDLNGNIKCGNSLIDDPAVAGDKAFEWKKEFPEIMNDGGFDVVIGNPPYVTRNLSDNVKNFININFATSQYQVDLYLCFIEKSIDLLSDIGLTSFITPNAWLKNLMMKNSRKYFLDNIKFEKILPNLSNVFKGANVDTLIYVGKKSSERNSISIYDLNESSLTEINLINQSDFLRSDNFIFSVNIGSNKSELISKIQNDTNPLSKYFDITRGVNPYDSYTGQSQEIIKSKAYHSTFKKDSTFVPEIRGRHIERYYYKWDGVHFISYGPWLAAPRDPKFFVGKRILFREILGERFVCALINEDIVIDRSLYIAKPNFDSEIQLNGVLGILASNLIAFYFRHIANEFDKLFPKIRLEEFKNLPIKSLDSPIITLISKLVASVIEYNSHFFSSIDRFLSRIQSNFTIEKPSNKLKEFYNYDFKTFVSELKKKKVTLSLKQQDEWEQYFNEYKTEINKLQQKINQTDREIDQLVYQLYGLTEEEIKIVEGTK